MKSKSSTRTAFNIGILKGVGGQLGQGWETIKSRLHLAPARAVLGQGWGWGFRGSKLTIPQIVRQQGNKQIKIKIKKRRRRWCKLEREIAHGFSIPSRVDFSPPPLFFTVVCVGDFCSLFIIFLHLFKSPGKKQKQTKKKSGKKCEKGGGKGEHFFFLFL